MAPPPPSTLSPPSNDDGPSSHASTSSASNRVGLSPPHYFPTPALDHAFSGIMAGAVATICMNPLDLIKVQFQVDTSSGTRRARRMTRQAAALGTATVERSALHNLARTLTGADVARDMYDALRDIVRRDGYAGLYRGLSPNVVGNSASWGLYFLFYTMIKEYMSDQQQRRRDAEHAGRPPKTLTAGQHLLAASESGAITALITNPIWVVKTRMFTTSRSGQPLHVSAVSGTAQSSQGSAGTRSSASATNVRSISSTAAMPAHAVSPGPTYSTALSGNTPASQEPIRGLLHGVRQIWKNEGIRGLYRGGGLALFGVSNGAIQFMAYEELKRWRMDKARAKKQGSSSADARSAGQDNGQAIQLDNIEYIVMSGLSKLAAIGLTYPYQVIRSRIQNHATAHIYPSIPACVRLTFKHEGIRGFYKGMAANAVRIVPGTCVTFVVYENCSWALRGLAERRDAKKRDERSPEHGGGYVKQYT